jgi:deoxyadenosine/deoxycytidine kinase
MIFLKCPVRTLKKRILQRGRKMEIEVPTEYLKDLNKLYDEWRGRYTMSPVIEIETDRLDYLTDLVDRLDLFQMIAKHLA